jgi:hypothetical protein
MTFEHEKDKQGVGWVVFLTTIAYAIQITI